MEDLSETLKNLEVEDILWILAIFTAIAAIVSNSLERDYLFTKDGKKKKEYKTINITLLILSFFISLYFLSLSYKDVKKLNAKTSPKKKFFTNENFIASSLVLIASILYITIEIFNEDEESINFLV